MPAHRPRWKSGIGVALGSVLVTSLLLWLPAPAAKVLTLVGALAFVVWYLLDPKFFFMRMARTCIGAGAAVSLFPLIRFGIQLPDGSWAAAIVDWNPSAQWLGGIILVAAGFGFGWLEHKQRNPDSTEKGANPVINDPTGPIQFQQAPVNATMHGGATFQGPVGTVIVQGEGRAAEAAGAAERTREAERSPHNLPPRGEHIVDRPEVLEEIHAALERERAVGVVKAAAARADGGYGKTIAAVMYAYAHAEDYPGGRYFIRCDQASIVGELAALGPLLGLERGDDEAEAAGAVKLHLERGGPCLLILDNVKDAGQWASEEFLALVPRGGGVRILVTSQAKDLPLETVPIGKLTTPQGVEVLAKFRGDARDSANKRHAEHLVEQVEGIAVAVAAIGAYMKLTPAATWKGFAEALEKGSLGTMDAHVPSMASQIGYPKKVVEVLDAAVDALPPAERRALEYAALMAADLVARPWLSFLLEQDKTIALAGAPGVELPAAEAVVDELIGLDLLRPSGKQPDEPGWAGETPLLSMHRAHRSRLAERLAGQREHRDKLLDALAGYGEAWAETSREALTNKGRRWELTPLVGLSIALDEAGRTETAVSVANWVQKPLWELGRYGEARALLERYADEVRVQAIVGEVEFATLLNNLATILRDLGDLKGARSRMERAIEIEESQLPEGHPALATSYSNLALILLDLGDLKGARERMEQAIEIGEKHYEGYHPALGTRYHNLAGICADEGKLDEAVRLEEKALGILRKHFDEEHPHVKSSRESLAVYRVRAGGKGQNR